MWKPDGARSSVRRVASVALQHWNTVAQGALDQIEAAHLAMGGSGRGRRYATLQVNHAYAVLLSSQFQRFCRNLHTEAVDALAKRASPPAVGRVLYLVAIQGRKLDQGNPNPGNLGADFSRFGMDFWASVNALDRRNAERQKRLETLATWRNAIAHQDWTKVANRPELLLRTVQAWRSTCRALATSFDAAVGAHLAGLVGESPW
jgi:hypothetical protein